MEGGYAYFIELLFYQLFEILRCGNDYVTVNDEKFCGLEKSKLAYKSNGSLEIQFKSENNVTNPAVRGFKFYIESNF